MRIGPDEAFDNLRKYVSDEWRHLSESDTRSKIIDPMLTACLNWQESDITREDHTDTGYIDYVLKVGTRNVLVIEAKKVGKAFTLPITYKFKRRLKVRYAISAHDSIREAMLQAQSYCASKGARFAVVTNGDQYIIFEALGTGEDWDEGNCIVFYNLSDIQDKFTQFWNVLSKDSVEKNGLVDAISRAEELRFVRVIDDVHFKNERKPRNDLSRYMQPIIAYAFQEITEVDKRDMLRVCYVYEKAFEEVDASLRSHFSKDMPAVYNEYEIKKIIEDDKGAGVFEADLDRFRKLLDEDTQEPIVFLLLGRIGSGKTTFVYRFFEAVLTPEEAAKTIWIYVNMRDAPIEEDSIRGYILESMLKDLSTRYTSIMSHVRNELGYTRNSASLTDLKPLFAIFKALGHTIYLVIDNVDQHRSKSPNFHELVFLEANNLTKELRTITILTLREESFYSSKITGVFNAYYINRYLIRAPDFITLVLYRLDYVSAKLNLPDTEFRRLIRTNLDLSSRAGDIRDFLKIVRDSIQSKRTRGISSFMKNISGENMRMSLDLFANFLISGNTKIDEMLGIYRSTGGYQIAYHHFLKSIMLGDYRYYSQEQSEVMNVFDFNAEYSSSHFLCLKILSYAKDHLDNASDVGRGYISINVLRSLGSDVLIGAKAIEDSLRRLARYGLIVLDTRSSETLEGASFFKITECGDYYLDVLINRFAYLELVVSDTPIADIDLVKDLRKVVHLSDLDPRFDKTKRFIDYLYEMEQREMNLNPEYHQSPLVKYRFVSGMRTQFEKERKYIVDAVRESQSRRTAEDQNGLFGDSTLVP